METNKDLTAEQKLGLLVEAELQKLSEMGKAEFTIDEIEQHAPKTYDLLYDCCEEEDEQNGVETSKFKLVESTKEGSEDVTFKISKK